MRTFLIQFSILASVLFSVNLSAQPIISFSTQPDAKGFSTTVSLQEKEVQDLYTIYKIIKKKDSEIDFVVYELFRVGLIAVFKKNPEKTAKNLKHLEYMVFGTKALNTLFSKKMDKIAKNAEIKNLVGDILVTIVQEKILDNPTAANY